MCAAGRFSGAAAASCTACDGDGEFSVTSDAGSSYCSVAGAGKKPLSGRNGVEDCAAGKFSEGGEDTCTSCADNSHSFAGSLFCYSCIPGKMYDADSGSTTNKCVNCDRNKYSSNGNDNSCNGCATNSYSDPGSPSTSCYTCSSGTEYSVVHLQCAHCAAAKFSDTGVQCFPCEGRSERGSVYNNNPTSSLKN